MDLKRFWRRYKQFGGIRLVWEYIWMELIQLCCKEIIAVLLGRRKPMEAYGCVMGQVGQNLKRKYLPVLDVLDSKYSKEVVTGNYSHHVWVC